MQYIECIHCHKRYAATPKMIEAMGKKKVRCTKCGKSFPILVYNAKEGSEMEASVAASG